MKKLLIVVSVFLAVALLPQAAMGQEKESQPTSQTKKEQRIDFSTLYKSGVNSFLTRIDHGLSTYLENGYRVEETPSSKTLYNSRGYIFGTIRYNRGTFDATLYDEDGQPAYLTTYRRHHDGTYSNLFSIPHSIKLDREEFRRTAALVRGRALNSDREDEIRARIENEIRKSKEAVKNLEVIVLKACEMNDANIIKNFMESINYTNVPEPLFFNSPLLSPLFIAIEQNAINVATYLLEIAEQHPELRNFVYGTGGAAAILATQKGQTEIVAALAKLDITVVGTDIDEIPLEFCVPTWEERLQEEL